MKKVSAAIHALGSSFFQEYTSGKGEKTPKTYNHITYYVSYQDARRRSLLDKSR